VALISLGLSAHSLFGYANIEMIFKIMKLDFFPGGKNWGSKLGFELRVSCLPEPCLRLDF
jgi:hypothetical protein